MPDVSAHASMFPAWPVNLGKFWLPVGGTSASTPLLASAFAALSARLGTRLGPVNGTLYALADEAVYDVRSGANGYNRRVPARHAHAATTSRAGSACRGCACCADPRHTARTPRRLGRARYVPGSGRVTSPSTVAHSMVRRNVSATGV